MRSPFVFSIGGNERESKKKVYGIHKSVDRIELIHYNVYVINKERRGQDGEAKKEA